MSCPSCESKYSVFRRENGCSNCGLSFCGKCVRQKCKIPWKGSGEYNVCKKCFTTLAQGPSTSQDPLGRPPPDTFLKRLEELENPAVRPITMYRVDNFFGGLRTGLSPEDAALVDRLEKLKERENPPPSEVELQERLARLKGQNIYVDTPSRPVLTARPEPQNPDDLLNQLVKESDIETSLSATRRREVEARLAEMREKGIRPNEGQYFKELEEDGSDQEVDKITKKIMHEVTLDESRKTLLRSTTASSKEDEPMDEEELPWCVLCNEDADFRCHTCSGDLYCKKCCNEVHKLLLAEEQHSIVRFKPN